MLQLSLGRPIGAPESLPPTARIEASGPHLLGGANAEDALGEYIGRGWRIRGKVHSLIEIDGPLVVGLQERGIHAGLGPFPNLLMVGNALFAGGAYLARYDEQDQKWRLNEAQPWTSIVIAAVELHGHPLLERNKMIAEAAYYRAEKRGFAPGHELSDWLEAQLHVGDIVTCPTCHQRWSLAGQTSADVTLASS